MEDMKNLYVGLDLGNENSQLCCFHPGSGELETIGGRPRDQYHLIPTLLGVTKKKREWFFGEEVRRIAGREEVCVIENLVRTTMEGGEFTVWESRLAGGFLLEKFFRKTLALLHTYYPSGLIARLVIAVEEESEELETAVFEALSRMGLERDRVMLIPYRMAYLHYALNQKPELWQNNIGLFHLGARGLSFHSIHINRESLPYAVEVISHNLSEHFSYEYYETMDPDVLRQRFLALAKERLEGEEIATLYFSGEGFVSDWSDTVLQKICAGKRGFRGPAIYVRGAAFYARNQMADIFSKQFMVLTDEVLKYRVSMRVYKDGKMVDLEVLPAGIPWQEARSVFTVIFDREEEITLLVKQVMDGTQSIRMITLEGVPQYPDRMERYELDFSYENETTCRIRVKDRGFGDLNPSTNRIWEKRLEL